MLHRRTQACRDEAGTWDCGGGVLEFGETPHDAVRREVAEEYGARALRIRALGVRNVLRDEGACPTHWVAFVFDVLVDPSEVTIGEPEKMACLDWFRLDRLPEPLHSQLRCHLELLPRRLRFERHAPDWASRLFRRVGRGINVVAGPVLRVAQLATDPPAFRVR